MKASYDPGAHEPMPGNHGSVKAVTGVLMAYVVKEEMEVAGEEAGRQVQF